MMLTTSKINFVCSVVLLTAMMVQTVAHDHFMLFMIQDTVVVLGYGSSLDDFSF